jgi:phage gp36-like protein
MSLVTLEHLEGEFGVNEMDLLATRDDNAVVRAQLWAEGVAAGYINAAQLTVPTPTPNELVGYVCDLIRWRLYDDAVTETVKLRYEAAIQWFNALVSGRLAPVWAVSTQTGGISYSTPYADADLAVSNRPLFTWKQFA